MSKGNRTKRESMTGSSLDYRDLENGNDIDFYENSDYYEDSDFYDDEFHFEDDGYENDDEEDDEEEEEEFFDEDEFPRLQKKAGRRGNIRTSLLDDIWDD
ncbi:MAG: hypothetical protein JEZ12_20980 [Desulfobacterium sp.]|nr:hypothetical protein [Desulfobacterium sp.]